MQTVAPGPIRVVGGEGGAGVKLCDWLGGVGLKSLSFTLQLKLSSDKCPGQLDREGDRQVQSHTRKTYRDLLI